MDDKMSLILLMLVLNIISDKRKLVCSWKASKKSFVYPSRQKEIEVGAEWTEQKGSETGSPSLTRAILTYGNFGRS